MLVRCPECEKEVSDRAHSCPGCGFPIGEHLAEVRAAHEAVVERASRRRDGDTDCVACQARGFVTLQFRADDGQMRDGFDWCEICEHTGRVALCRSDAGWWAIRRSAVEAFLVGTIDEQVPDAVRLGPEPPAPRYPTSS